MCACICAITEMQSQKCNQRNAITEMQLKNIACVCVGKRPPDCRTERPLNKPAPQPPWSQSAQGRCQTSCPCYLLTSCMYEQQCVSHRPRNRQGLCKSIMCIGACACVCVCVCVRTCVFMYVQGMSAQPEECACVCHLHELNEIAIKEISVKETRIKEMKPTQREQSACYL